MAKFVGNPSKILGGVRITVVGAGPFDVNNGELICILGILVYSEAVF